MKLKINITRYNYNNINTEELDDPCQPALTTVADMVEYLQGDSIQATANSDGLTFSAAMRELPYGCYSAPDYEIVSSKSGRSNESIRDQIFCALLK